MKSAPKRILAVVGSVVSFQGSVEVGVLSAELSLALSQSLLVDGGVDVIIDVDVLGVLIQEAGLVQDVPCTADGVGQVSENGKKKRRERRTLERLTFASSF